MDVEPEPLPADGYVRLGGSDSLVAPAWPERACNRFVVGRINLGISTQPSGEHRRPNSIPHNQSPAPHSMSKWRPRGQATHGNPFIGLPHRRFKQNLARPCGAYPVVFTVCATCGVSRRALGSRRLRSEEHTSEL